MEKDSAGGQGGDTRMKYSMVLVLAQSHLGTLKGEKMGYESHPAPQKTEV